MLDPRLISPVSLTSLQDCYDTFVAELNQQQSSAPLLLRSLWLTCRLFQSMHESQHATLSQPQLDVIETTAMRCRILLYLLGHEASAESIVVQPGDVEGTFDWALESAIIEFSWDDLVEGEQELVHMAQAPIPDTTSYSEGLLRQGWSGYRQKAR